MIGRLCDAALLFVQAGATRKQVLQRAVEQLAAGGLSGMQMVLIKHRRTIPSLASARAWLKQRSEQIREPARQETRPPAYPPVPAAAPAYSATPAVYAAPSAVAALDDDDPLDE